MSMRQTPGPLRGAVYGGYIIQETSTVFEPFMYKRFDGSWTFFLLVQCCDWNGKHFKSEVLLFMNVLFLNNCHYYPEQILNENHFKKLIIVDANILLFNASVFLKRNISWK